MGTVLVFGCAGFVGGYLIRELIAHGYKVVGADIVSMKVPVQDQAFTYCPADLLSYESVFELIEKFKPDFIINLAAISSVSLSWKIPQTTMTVNVNGSLNILQAVRHAKINPRILLVGSSEEYAVSETKISENHPIIANNPYGIAKVAQERFSDLYRQKYGLNIVNTRTFNHTGVGQSDTFVLPSFITQVAAIDASGTSGVISVGNLSVYRDIGDVRDMVSAYRLLLEGQTQSTVFNVGSGERHKLSALLKYIISLTPQTVEIRTDPDKLRPIDNPVIWCDNSRIQSEVGWKPKYSIFATIDTMFTSLTRKL